MELKIASLIIATLISLNLFAQKTIILQPGSEDGKDARINSLNRYTSGKTSEFSISAWTFNGNFGKDRSLVQFDLSSIKKGAKIQQAKLYLYGAKNLSSGGHSTLSGSNEVLIQRITSTWDENTVTWSNQPNVSGVNEVVVPASTNEYQNYSIDITNLVQDMVNDPKNSYGFMLRQLTEQYYRRMNFASSDYHDPDKWPKLIVSYYKNSDEYESENPKEEDKVTIEHENNLPDLGDMINIYPKYTKNLIHIDNGAYMRMKNYKLNIIDKHSNILYKSIVSDKNFKIDIQKVIVEKTTMR